jgi:hypothetical protein
MLEGWFFITAALLVLSGGSKFRDPEPTRGALRAARLPSSRHAVLALATAEIAIAATALLWPSPWAAGAVAVAYFGFAGFVAAALARRWPIQSCGCFGRSDSRPGASHLVVNLANAGAAVAVAAAGGLDLGSILAAQPGAGLPYIGFVAIGSFLLALVMSELPGVLRGRA